LTNFSELGLAGPILKALREEGYTTPTPIQVKAIPGVLAGRDLLGIAQTGTGKTAAFALPILHRLAANRLPAQRKSCRVLVLSPTRELASQIADSFRTYGRHLGVSVAVVYGGVGHAPQIRALARGVDVLVATPGRLLDHIAERNLVLTGAEVFVLDEADRMLDLGFLPPIRRIVAQLPSKRQNLFFSATMPREMGKLAEELLRDPVRISVAPPASTVDLVSQRVLHVESHKKRALLVELFVDPQMSRALVFTRTKRGADKVARHLEAAGIRVAAIHGNKSQSQREQALAAFRSAKIRALVATDIAARGIDIDQVTHVVNFELPDVPESYVHRIGRTARAGSTGSAISFCDGDEREQLRDIERLTRQPIPAEDRRHDTRPSLVLPESRHPGRGGRQQPRQSAFHARQQRQKNSGLRPASGNAGHHGAPRRDARRTGSL
jgi:ATP-dependent RNA helicase RhlE